MVTKNYKAKFIFTKIALLVATLLLITSCNPFGPSPLPTTDMPKSYDLEQNYRTVSANNNAWMDTGIKIGENYGYIIHISGNVFLCSTQGIYTISGSSPSKLVQTDNDGNSIKLNQFDQVFIYPAPSGTSSTDTTPSPLQKTATTSILNGLSVYADDDLITTANDTADLVSQKLQEYNILPSGTLPANVAGLSQASITAIQSSSFISAIASNKGGVLGLAYHDGITPSSDQSFKVIYNSCSVTNGVNPNGDQGKLQFLISSVDPNANGDDGAITIDGNMYKDIASDNGNLWVKMYDCDDCYNDNNGTYQLDVTVLIPEIDNSFSHLIKLIVNPVKKTIKQVQTAIFYGFSQSNKFQTLVKATLILYISIYGLYFALGLAKASQKDFVTRIFKIGLVIALISDNAWNFFNDHFFKLFDEGASYIIASATGQSSNNQFGFIDTVMSLFFTKHTWLKISSFLLSVPGWVFLIIFIYSLFTYMLIIITAVVSYLFSYTGLAIIISIGPLFMIAILFEPTRNYFNNWVREIINFALQPVLLFTAIIIVNQMIIQMFLAIMSFQAVWGCKVPIYLNFGKLGKLNLFCIKMYCPGTSCEDSSSLNMITFIPKMMVFVILIQFLKYLLELIPEICEKLVHSTTSSSSSAEHAIQDIAGKIGWDERSAHSAKHTSAAFSNAIRPRPPLTQKQLETQEANLAQQYSKNAQTSLNNIKSAFAKKSAEFGEDYKVGIATQKASLDRQSTELSNNKVTLLRDSTALSLARDIGATKENVGNIKVIATNMEALYQGRHADLQVKLETNEQKLDYGMDLQMMEEGSVINFDSPIYMDKDATDKIQKDIAGNRRELNELEQNIATVRTTKELSTTLETAFRRSSNIEPDKPHLIAANERVIQKNQELLNEQLVEACKLQEKEIAANNAEAQKITAQLRELETKKRDLNHLQELMAKEEMAKDFFEKDARAQKYKLETTKEAKQKDSKEADTLYRNLTREHKDTNNTVQRLHQIDADLKNVSISDAQRASLQAEHQKLLRKYNLQIERLNKIRAKQAETTQRIASYQTKMEEAARLEKELPSLAKEYARKKKELKNKGNPYV